MTLAQEMFAIAPAYGRATVSAPQASLLTGKAIWLQRLHTRGFPVVPSIVLTRAAWDGLQAERRRGDVRLRAHWIATLFRLVPRDGETPVLVVRTSATQHQAGLMPARTGVAAPVSAADSVDPNHPLARAIAEALGSYDPSDPDPHAAERAIVLVQAMAEGEQVRFLTRDAQTGAPGPAPAENEPLPLLPLQAAELVRLLDAEAGRHMCVTVVVRDGQVRMLSARTVQMSAAAELEAAVDRVANRVWSAREAVAGIDPSRLPQLLHPRLRSGTAALPIATGLGVSPGAASGLVVFTPEDAERQRARGRHCILVVTETGPTDIEGMKAATGILTARGGMTSHAAVVARITGRPCVAGVRTLSVDTAAMTCRIGGQEFRLGDRLTIDGTDGAIYRGALPLSQPHIGGAMGQLLDWSDATRRIEVRANAETVEAARTALSFGAEGIGLARSEHMFFSQERMVALRRLILSENEADRC